MPYMATSIASKFADIPARGRSGGVTALSLVRGGAVFVGGLLVRGRHLDPALPCRQSGRCDAREHRADLGGGCSREPSQSLGPPEKSNSDPQTGRGLRKRTVVR